MSTTRTAFELEAQIDLVEHVLNLHPDLCSTGAYNFVTRACRQAAITLREGNVAAAKECLDEARPRILELSETVRDRNISRLLLALHVML